MSNHDEFHVVAVLQGEGEVIDGVAGDAVNLSHAMGSQDVQNQVGHAHVVSSVGCFCF